MSKKLKLAAGFIGLATLASTLAPAMADQGYGHKGHGMRDRDGHRGAIEERFKSADADSDGAVTFEEFAAAMDGRLGKADSDGDGMITVEEAVAAIQKRQEERTRRMAERIINRLDSSNDGKLSVEELDASRQRLFARLDRDNDGKIARDEIRFGRHGGDRDHHGRHGGHHGPRGDDGMERSPMGGEGNSDRPDAPATPEQAGIGGLVLLAHEQESPRISRGALSIRLHCE